MHLISNRVRLFLLTSAALSLTACADTGIWGPSISDLTTTTGFISAFQPADQTDIFYIDSPQICCSAKLIGANRNTEIDANWVYIKGDMSKEADPVIGSGKIHCSDNSYFGFTLPAPDGGFISGEYEINLSIGGKHRADRTFCIQKEQSGEIPRIQTFIADPLNVTEGQPLLLKWQVSNANRVTIAPDPGQVQPEGNLNLVPSIDTTYTLWAVNRRGASSRSLSVKVQPAAAADADLEIIDFWNTGNILFYSIKNTGIAASVASNSYLYKNDLLVAYDYVTPLDPGQEKVDSFATYHFSPRFPSVLDSSTTSTSSDSVNMRICLNADAAFSESDESNNCMEHNFGPLLAVNLDRYAASAIWQSSRGQLKWPMTKETEDNWAQMGTGQMNKWGSYPDSIVMTLPAESNSWMQATIGVPQGNPAVLQSFDIPHKTKLSAMIGLTDDAPASASVKFIFGTAQGSDITYYPPVVINMPGKLEMYEVDLSKLAGEQVQFILRVESSEPLQQGSAVWIDPSLTQES
ncbi:MAG: hypothetical protein JW901_12645 [Dehalococcoidia bacterium]|nr:hypothetical protein [Dehalococcoidia bacterium]